MQVFKEIKPLRAFLNNKRNTIATGLVPTMGALHAGHLSLIKESKNENQLTICSIFVNPTQFNNPSDLEKYPRNLDGDLQLLEQAGCDIVFAPDRSEMYQHPSSIKFDFGKLDKILEGEYRPGHFSGVALVVSKLFHIVQPTIAYFGQKDYQQFKVIEKLVDELKFDIQLKCMPIFREANGLAMSSRNMRLSEQERKKAIVLYESLVSAKELLLQGETLLRTKEFVIEKWKSMADVKLDYFELADSENLNLLETVTGKSVLLIAGFVGEVRLIDNLLLNE
jgi:pantoate--beta-alanine ligase